MSGVAPLPFAEMVVVGYLCLIMGCRLHIIWGVGSYHIQSVLCYNIHLCCDGLELINLCFKMANQRAMDSDSTQINKTYARFSLTSVICAIQAHTALAPSSKSILQPQIS